jgi:galactokinase
MIGAADVTAQFVRRFGGSPPDVFWAPGRVNLIGDHIDYCGGVVLPMSIQFGTTIGARASNDGYLRCVSRNAPTEPLEMRQDAPPPFPVGSWGRFVTGALAVLSQAGIRVRGGANVFVAGDIPGSGLSSSASLSVGLLFVLAHLAQRTLEPIDLALGAQRIENEYVGVQCGLMDQAAVTLSEPGAALLFDCYDHHHQSIPIDPAIDILVADTRLARKLVHSQYNARLDETRRAAVLLGVEHAALARIDPARFREREERITDPVVRRRARHVVTEQSRVHVAATALRAGDWQTFGRALNESHASLRDDYEVSCPELDVLAEALRSQPGCYGARMTGAGFGGNCVALFDAGTAEHAMPAAGAVYRARFGIEPSGFVAQSRGGVRRLE